MKIREELLAESKNYSKNIPQATEDILDCSLGENPYGYSESVKTALQNIDISNLAHYPHSPAAKNAIIKNWQGQANLSANNITLSDGSIDALYLINSMFLGADIKVVGFLPTFTDMVVNCSLLGMEYMGVKMDPSDNYRANVDRLIEKLDNSTTFIYIDVPNNPTGQIISLDDIKKVLEKADDIGAGVVVDEAYGDFITREESAISLLDDYDNLMVIRTFSKGFGLAGLRAGYILASEYITKAMGKLSNPYTIGEMTREVLAVAMEDASYPIKHAGDFSDAKRKIEQVADNNLKMLSTDYRVPICALQHKDPDADLQQLLFEEKILAVSGVEFDGLGKNFVRLRVPESADVDKLIEAIKRVNG